MSKTGAVETLTLTDFLLARITEDEMWARTHVRFIEVRDTGSLAEGRLVHRAKESRTITAERLVAECEAKRRIVDWAAPVVSGVRHENEDGRDLLTILALPYADHPDYRQEWA